MTANTLLSGLRTAPDGILDVGWGVGGALGLGPGVIVETPLGLPDGLATEIGLGVTTGLPLGLIVGLGIGPLVGLAIGLGLAVLDVVLARGLSAALGCFHRETMTNQAAYEVTTLRVLHHVMAWQGRLIPPQTSG